MLPCKDLAERRLYVLIDGGRSEEQFVKLVRGLVEAGADVLQLRDKQLDDRSLVARARVLRRLTQGTGTLFVVNDRPDIALLADADGVHVGQDELSVVDVRRLVGPEKLIGVSTHSVEQARRAELDGADYIGVGPTFPSGTKPFDSYPGVALVRRVAQAIQLPAFAIGGISIENVTEVLDAGASRIAVGSAVTAAEDPAAAVRAFLKLLD